MKYYAGIDIGGTNISTGIVDENYEIVGRAKIKTDVSRGYKGILPDIVQSVRDAAENAELELEEIRWIGIGCPGTCNPETGIVEYSNNLRWDNVPLLADVEAALGRKAYLDNDANAAGYGEYLAGAAKGAKNAVIITLGTGVGAGIIINGKIFSGSNFAGGEIGHTVITVDGYECTCGRKGCFEAYSSATGLVRMTREAAEQHPESKIRQLVEADGRISARTAFNAVDRDRNQLVHRHAEGSVRQRIASRRGNHPVPGCLQIPAPHLLVYHIDQHHLKQPEQQQDECQKAENRTGQIAPQADARLPFSVYVRRTHAPSNRYPTPRRVTI